MCVCDDGKEAGGAVAGDTDGEGGAGVQLAGRGKHLVGLCEDGDEARGVGERRRRKGEEVGDGVGVVEE